LFTKISVAFATIYDESFHPRLGDDSWGMDLKSFYRKDLEKDYVLIKIEFQILQYMKHNNN